MRNQLNRGVQRRLMYVENKVGLIDGVQARIGWVSFSRSGRTVYYRGRDLQKGHVGDGSNYFDVVSGEGYWISGVKRRGSNIHPCEPGVALEIDGDARDEWEALRSNQMRNA